MRRTLVLFAALALLASPALADREVGQGRKGAEGEGWFVESVGSTVGGEVVTRARVDASGAQYVRITSPGTGTGELVTAGPRPLVRVMFPYNVNTRNVNTKVSGSGAVSHDSTSRQALIQTTAATSSWARLRTNDVAIYRPGQMIVARMGLVFSTCTAGSTQVGGIGGEENGLFFGCNGDAFGVLRKHSGRHEVQTFTVTVGSSTVESVTVTLAGTPTVCAGITASASTTTSAAEVAACNYGPDWTVEQIGSTVIFLNNNAADQTGTFSIVATTLDGAFVETMAGVASTLDWTPQTSWSEDTLDGDADAENPSGYDLVQATGYNYSIRLNWSGYGTIGYYIDIPRYNRPVLIHKIEHEGTATTPSLTNPSFPLHVRVDNTTNSTDVFMKVASLAAFSVGEHECIGDLNGTAVSKLAVGTSFTNLLTIRNNRTFAGFENYQEVRAISVSISNLGSTNGEWEVRKNGDVSGTQEFNYISEGTSTMSVDVSDGLVTNGTFIDGNASPKATEGQRVEFRTLFLAPTDTLTIAGKAKSGTTDFTASVTWIDE